MKKFMGVFLLTIFLLIVTPIEAQQSAFLDKYISELIEVERNDNKANGNWIFNQLVNSDGNVTEAHFDPRKNASLQWELISVDGEVPSKNQVLAFQKAKLDENKEEKSFFSELKFSEVINAPTLTLVKKEQGFLHYSFAPSMSDDKDSQDNFNGYLVINEQSQHIDSIRIQNRHELSPAFSVSLDEVLITAKFGDVEGKPVIQNRQLQIHGTIGFFKEINKQLNVEYSQHQYIPDVIVQPPHTQSD
ncbi:MAG: hypothetical protein ACI9QV_000794 [Methylophagaceae bacterium]|jgi:hypothetical protein